MMKKMSLTILCALFLAGCWDQDSLKEIRMPTILSFDSHDKHDISGRALIRVPIGTSKGEEKMTNEQIAVTGNNLLDCYNKIDQRSSEKTNYSQVQVMLLGEDYAKKHIKNFIDSYLSLNKSSYNAQVAITEGKASDIMQKRKKNTPLLDEYLTNLVETGIQLNMTPNTTSKIVHNQLHDPGYDVVIPYIKETKQEDILALAGVALIHDGKYTGETLDTEQTELLLAFMKQYGEKMWIPEKKELETMPFLINKVYSEYNVNEKTATADNIDITYNLTMHINVNEQSDHLLNTPKKLKAANKKLSKYYTAQAEKLFSKLHESSCDALGIGRSLIAYHNDLWCKLKDDKDYYQKISVTPKINITIVNTTMTR